MRIFQIKYRGEAIYVPEVSPEEFPAIKGFFLEAQSTKKLLAFKSVDRATYFFRTHNLKEQIEDTVHIDLDNFLKWIKAEDINAPPGPELNNFYWLMLDFYVAAYSGENEKIPYSLDYPQLMAFNRETGEQVVYEMIAAGDRPDLLTKCGIRPADQAKLRDMRNNTALKVEVEQLLKTFLEVLQVQHQD